METEALYNKEFITISEVRRRLIENVKVLLEGYSTWSMESYIELNGYVLPVSQTTDNEENYTGIFDGDKYNYLPDTLYSQEEKEALWSDTANIDNYETVDERNERIVDTYLLQAWIDQYSDDFEEIGIYY